MNIKIKILTILTFTSLLSGCELVNDLSGANLKQEQLKNAHAIGSACRQAGKSIELCFELNQKSLKSGIFDGWKEMDLYMRENKLESQPNQTSKIKEIIVEEFLEEKPEKIKEIKKDNKDYKIEITKPNLQEELEKNN